jgi:hypothetical protein
MSALPPKADIVQQGGNVRFVPNADPCTAAQRMSLFDPPHRGARPGSDQTDLGQNFVELFLDVRRRGNQWTAMFIRGPLARPEELRHIFRIGMRHLRWTARGWHLMVHFYW